MSSCERWAELRDREAVGEILTVVDAAFERQHRANCAVCGQEAKLYAQLAKVANADLSLSDQRLEHNVLTAYSAHQRRERRTRIFAWTLGVATLAACVVLLVRTQRQEPSTQPQSLTAQTTSAPSGATQVTAAEGPKCISLPPQGTACLHRGAVAWVDQDTPGRVLVKLQTGVLVSSWEQQAGWRYSVATREWSLTTTAATFSVELLAASVRVVVAHGALEVRHTDGRIRNLLAPASAILTDDVSVSSVSAEALEHISAVLPGSSADSKDKALPAATAPSPELLPPVKHVAPVAPVASPAGYLERAQRLRSQGRQAEAAREYGLLLKEFPNSAEAQTALVSLAGLELSHLGRPERALGLFDRYLASGGRLAQEAHHGKILALRRLNRVSAERAEVLRFIKLYPQAVQTRSLKSRLTQLDESKPTRGEVP